MWPRDVQAGAREVTRSCWHTRLDNWRRRRDVLGGRVEQLTMPAGERAEVGRNSDGDRMLQVLLGQQPGATKGTS